MILSREESDAADELASADLEHGWYGYDGATSEWVDAELWKPHPPTEDCPICIVPMPLEDEDAWFLSCCGKMICRACDEEHLRAHNMTNEKRDKKELPPLQIMCAFCRAPCCWATAEEDVKCLENRMERGDSESISTLAEYYLHGECGLEKDQAKSWELSNKAAELGSSDAITKVGWCYAFGEHGISRNVKKGRALLQTAVKKGSADARYSLALLERNSGYPTLHIKHLRLAAAAGHNFSVKELWKAFHEDKLSKRQLEESLRAHQTACDQMSTVERKRFLSWREAKDGTDELTKRHYIDYYSGKINAAVLKKALAEK